MDDTVKMADGIALKIKAEIDRGRHVYVVSVPRWREPAGWQAATIGDRSQLQWQQGEVIGRLSDD